mmetsp:Transcript_20925/g.31936  ORF Transcript_20925/g.31936 Transcript_20925/m.31936 type:complete len:88 (-) Transcript_20925:674-937(-)
MIATHLTGTLTMQHMSYDFDWKGNDLFSLQYCWWRRESQLLDLKGKASTTLDSWTINKNALRSLLTCFYIYTPLHTQHQDAQPAHKI